MKRKTGEEPNELRTEYDLAKLKFVGRGTYAKRYRSGTNLVLLEPDVRKAFPDDVSVNEALRVVAKTSRNKLQEYENRLRVRENTRLGSDERAEVLTPAQNGARKKCPGWRVHS